MSVNKRRPENKRETLQEFEHRLKVEAKELSLQFKNIKPTKFLLK